MPYLQTAQSWLSESNRLLEARASTTRITTKYTIKSSVDSSTLPNPPKSRAKPSSDSLTTESQSTTPGPRADPIRATLTLKTYDSASGTTLKYSTAKAAEVSRLVQILGRLARPMAGLPELKEDTLMVDTAATGDVENGTAMPVAEPARIGAGQGVPGGKKGKKKGKK